jgi:hypothetical protein
LLFTYVGYKAATTIVNGEADLKIELQKDVVSLSDVVVLQRNNFTRFNTLTKIDLDLKPVRNTQELLRLVPVYLLHNMREEAKLNRYFCVV